VNAAKVPNIPSQSANLPGLSCVACSQYDPYPNKNKDRIGVTISVNGLKNKATSPANGKAAFVTVAQKYSFFKTSNIIIPLPKLSGPGRA